MPLKSQKRNRIKIVMQMRSYRYGYLYRYGWGPITIPLRTGAGEGQHKLSIKCNLSKQKKYKNVWQQQEALSLRQCINLCLRTHGLFGKVREKLGKSGKFYGGKASIICLRFRPEEKPRKQLQLAHPSDNYVRQLVATRKKKVYINICVHLPQLFGSQTALGKILGA